MALPGILQRLLDHINTAAAHGSVVTGRKLNTTAPLTGGGDLSTDRTLGVSSATESARGVVELATATETSAGTDSSKAVHPAGLRAAINAAMTSGGDTAFTIFDANGTFTAPAKGTAFVTVVGGGQTGGHYHLNNSSCGAGGQAGQIVQAYFEMKDGDQAAVVVGGGGGTGFMSKGGASSFGNVTAAAGNLLISSSGGGEEGFTYAYERFDGEQTTYGKNGVAVQQGSGGITNIRFGGGGQGGYHYPLLNLGRNVKAGDAAGKGGLGYGAGGGSAGPVGSSNWIETPGRGYRGIVTVLFVPHA